MGALDGLRVIDFGQWVAGPLAGMLLADQGAEVIRVDPRGGPAWDTPANAIWNRGKARISLDLKQGADRRTAEQLIASADVVIENFRPGVMDRLGLGAEQMTTRDDRLIYLSMPGFSARDERRDIAAWEGVVSAGVGTYFARLGGTPSTRPIYTAIPIASVYGAFVGVTATAMALVARERDGLGQRIESPLHDAVYQAVGVSGLRVIGPGSRCADRCRGSRPMSAPMGAGSSSMRRSHTSSASSVRPPVSPSGSTSPGRNRHRSPAHPSSRPRRAAASARSSRRAPRWSGKS